MKQANIIEIINSKGEPLLLSVLKKDTYYSLNEKNGISRRLKYVKKIKEDLEKYIILKIDSKNGRLSYTDISKLEEYLYLLENRTNPESIKAFALNHDTHNKKIEEIEEQQSYFFYKNVRDLIPKVASNLVTEGSGLLIIVENQRVFDLKYNELKVFLRKFNFELNEADILFGSGNKVNSKKIIPFFNLYDEIIYLGDLDDEGYKIYQSLRKNINTPFLFPKKEIFKNIEKEIVEARKKNEKKKKSVFLDHNGALRAKIRDLYTLGQDDLFEMQQEVFFDK